MRGGLYFTPVIEVWGDAVNLLISINSLMKRVNTRIEIILSFIIPMSKALLYINNSI